MLYYKGKTVLITGASSGIGECFAKQVNAMGAFVVLSSRRQDELRRVQVELPFPENSSILVMDMLDNLQIDSACNQILTARTIDIVFLNAGISQRSKVIETSFEVEEKIWATNFAGLVRVAKRFLPHFTHNKSGHYIVISSVTGKIGIPGRSSYAASKHALHGYFDSLRAEVFNDNIAVTLVCPGYVFTSISQNALKANGEKQNSIDENSRNGMDVEVFVRKALKGIARKKEELLIGGKEIFTVYLKRFLPHLLSRLIRNIKKSP